MTVHAETDRRVLVITIDRPDVRNAVDGPTAAELNDAVDRLERDDDLDVAVLTGAAGTFCAGADLKAIAGGRGNVVTELGAAEIVDSPGPMGPTRRITTKPVVAAVEGHAVAGGLELALWCDLRVAARDAIFGVFCRRWGVPLIDGGTIRLPRLIGHSHAMDMILTGRAVDGEEAHRIGLANRVVESGAALAAAIELAASLSAFPQGCMRSDRRAAIEQWGDDVGAALAREAELGMATIRSGETRRGAERFAGGEGRHGTFD
ncbi:MAG: crotonase/enoyl-CoA hydratase family protein [Actinomycetota bacterium]